MPPLKLPDMPQNRPGRVREAPAGDGRRPAWKKYGIAKTVKPGTIILHSKADDVVPLADSDELVRHSGLPKSALVGGGDHRQADPEPLEAMLRECEGQRK